MASVDVLPSSRLRFFTFVEKKNSGGESFLFWAPDPGIPPSLPVANDEIDYTVRGRDVIDNITQKVYGDPFLWWVLARSNNLRLLPFDLKLGSKIRVPSQRLVDQTLL